MIKCLFGAMQWGNAYLDFWFFGMCQVYRSPLLNESKMKVNSCDLVGYLCVGGVVLLH